MGSVRSVLYPSPLLSWTLVNTRDLDKEKGKERHILLDIGDGCRDEKYRPSCCGTGTFYTSQEK